MPGPTGRDQTMCPSVMDSATNRPLPGERPLCDSAGMTTTPALGAMAGDAAHSVPTFRNHLTCPVRMSMARAEQSSSRTNSVSW